MLRTPIFVVAAALLPFVAAPAAAQDPEPPPPATGEVTITATDEGVEARLVVRFRDPAAAPADLVARARDEGGDEAVRAVEGGGIELHFTLPGMDEVIPVLRRAKEGVEALPVLIRIPAEYPSADMWTFQARLSQAGIRQVRITTDPGPRPPR